MKSNKKMLLLSVIGIILVVLSHTKNTINLFGDIFPYGSFFMPMFIFISGYFYKNDNSPLWGKEGYIFKKIKKLLIPYFIWNFIYGALGMILRYYNIINYGEDINVKTFFIEPWIQGHQYCFNLAAWFVPALFLTNVIYAILRDFITKFKVWNDTVALIGFYSIFMIIYISIFNSGMFNEIIIILLRTSFYLFIYHFGFYYKIKLEGKIKIDRLIYLLILICIQLILLKLGANTARDAWDIRSNLKIPFLPTLLTINGILFWTKIAEILEPVLTENKIINYIGNNTYDIMMHHLFFCFLFNSLIMMLSDIFNLSGFDVENFKSTIYYFYYPGYIQWCFIYTLVGIGGPLITKYIYKQISHKIFARKVSKI